MSSFVFVTQLLDADDPVLGFVVRQVEALCERADQVVVVANQVGRVPDRLGAEVVSLGKERGYGRARRTLNYQRAIGGLARRLRPITLLTHMCPIYLDLAAPAVKATGGRAMLWFAHPATSATLAVAERMADVVLTTLPGSYPRSSPKVRVIGQAVDTGRFFPEPERHREGQARSFRLLAIGRTSPVKGYPTVVHAVSLARGKGADVTLDIVGPSTNPLERSHRRALEAQIGDLGLAEWVRLEDGVAHDQIADRLRSADAVVNSTRSGSADKGVFEAMATGRPVLFSNPALLDLLADTGLALHFPTDDADTLASRIASLATTPPQRLRHAGAELRARVEQGHSLAHWADAVVSIADELRPSVRVR